MKDRFGYDLGIIGGLCSALILNIQLSNSFWSLLIARGIKGIAYVLLVSLCYTSNFEVYPTSEKYHHRGGQLIQDQSSLLGADILNNPRNN